MFEVYAAVKLQHPLNNRIDQWLGDRHQREPEKVRPKFGLRFQTHY